MSLRNLRHISVPYTGKEAEKFINLVKTFPTYKNGSVLASDIPKIIEEIKLVRTKEQIEAYVDFFNENFGGDLHIELIEKHLLNVHSTSSYGRTYLEKFDTDKDGIISKSEFEKFLQLFIIHEPKLEGKSYEEFLSEADSDLDGRVSIDEAEAWIKKYSN